MEVMKEERKERRKEEESMFHVPIFNYITVIRYSAIC